MACRLDALGDALAYEGLRGGGGGGGPGLRTTPTWDGNSVFGFGVEGGGVTAGATAVGVVDAATEAELVGVWLEVVVAGLGLAAVGGFGFGGGGGGGAFDGVFVDCTTCWPPV